MGKKEKERIQYKEIMGKSYGSGKVSRNCGRRDIKTVASERERVNYLNSRTECVIFQSESVFWCACNFAERGKANNQD